MKYINYALTFIGRVEVDEDCLPGPLTDEMAREIIKDKYYNDGFNFDYVNDVEYEVEEY